MNPSIQSFQEFPRYLEEACAQRLARGLLRFVTIRAFRSCCAGEVWYLEAGTDAPRKHQDISSSSKDYVY